MPIVISDSFVLSDSTPQYPVTADHPIVGWHNIVTATNIAATHEDPDFPASNLATGSTYEDWRSDDDGEQFLTITTGYVDEIDYVGVAKHNWGTEQVTVSIEGFIDGVWEELVGEMLLADDAPLLFRFTAQSLSHVRIRLQAPTDALPRAAVVYVGKLLTLERKIWNDHVPLPHGRKTEIQNGRSESGNFMGRIVLGAWRESVIPLSLLSPDWVRDYAMDFLIASATTPFFFGWRPETYPLEVGYVWTTEDPMPVPKSPDNRIAFDIKVSGVA